VIHVKAKNGVQDAKDNMSKHGNMIARVPKPEVVPADEAAGCTRNWIAASLNTFMHTGICVWNTYMLLR
jgi:hypothetical protein